jgi:hypothetical protein
MPVKSIITRGYEKYIGWTLGENKANMPDHGWKSEARNSKSDNSGCVAGRLLPHVGRETS